MKRKDISLGEYAVRADGKVHHALIEQVLKHRVIAQFERQGIAANWTLTFAAVLMPWPAWEAEQKAKKERDVEVQAQHAENMAAADKEHDELWAFNLRIQEIRWRLAEFGVGATLSWEDLARLLHLPVGP